MDESAKYTQPKPSGYTVITSQVERSTVLILAIMLRSHTHTRTHIQCQRQRKAGPGEMSAICSGSKRHGSNVMTLHHTAVPQEQLIILPLSQTPHMDINREGTGWWDNGRSIMINLYRLNLTLSVSVGHPIPWSHVKLYYSALLLATFCWSVRSEWKEEVQRGMGLFDFSVSLS